MLAEFYKSMDEVAKARQREHRLFNKRLGEPAVFIPEEVDGRFGVGYWRATGGGVFSYRRYANGYDPNTRTEFSPELIGILNKISKRSK